MREGTIAIEVAGRWIVEVPYREGGAHRGGGWTAHWLTTQVGDGGVQEVAAAVGAFRGGAKGVILSRKYSEMKLDNLSGAGMALEELGYAL
jgi:hypothetical protein